MYRGMILSRAEDFRGREEGEELEGRMDGGRDRGMDGDGRGEGRGAERGRMGQKGAERGTEEGLDGGRDGWTEGGTEKRWSTCPRSLRTGRLKEWTKLSSIPPSPPSLLSPSIPSLPGCSISSPSFPPLPGSARKVVPSSFNLGLLLPLCERMDGKRNFNAMRASVCVRPFSLQSGSQRFSIGTNTRN